MNFKNIFHEAAVILSKIEDNTKTIIASLLTLTGGILSALQDKGAIDILSLISPEIKAAIPNIEQLLSKAILTLTEVQGVEQITQQPGQSDEDFLKEIMTKVLESMQSSNFFAIHAFWVKIASIIIGLIDGNKQNESMYDFAMQSAITKAKHPTA